MEKLSELVPLLLVGLVYILSAVNSSRKKKEEAAKKANPNTQRIPPVPTPIQEIPSVTSPLPRKESLQEKKIPQVQSHPVFVSSSPKIHNRKEKPILLEEEYTEPFINVSDKDEIKKAIIYAEIFNRKYD